MLKRGPYYGKDARYTVQGRKFQRPGGRQKRHTLGAKVRRIIDRTKEKKYIDITISSSAPVSGTSLVVLLSGVAEGDTELLRDGQEIYLHSIKIRGTIVGNAASTTDSPYRLLLVRAKHNVEGILPTVVELLESDLIRDFIQIDSRGDYTIVWDMWNVIPVSTTSGDQHMKLIKYKKHFKRPQKATFDGAGATIADCERGHYFLVLISGDVNTEQPAWNIETRIAFKE